PAAGKAAERCQRALTVASATLVGKELKGLVVCANGGLACAEETPGDLACRAKAGERRGRGLARVAAQEQRGARAAVGRCPAPPVAFTTWAEATGLGFGGGAAACVAELGTTPRDVSSLATCVVRRERCRAERLFAVAAPRSAELMRIAGVDAGVPACLFDAGG